MLQELVAVHMTAKKAGARREHGLLRPPASCNRLKRDWPGRGGISQQLWHGLARTRFDAGSTPARSPGH